MCHIKTTSAYLWRDDSITVGSEARIEDLVGRYRGDQRLIGRDDRMLLDEEPASKGTKGKTERSEKGTGPAGMDL